MSKKDEALKLALEALEAKGDAWIVLERKAKAAIREALAEQPVIQQGWDVDDLLDKPKQPAQQQEPVAYASDVEFDDETEIIPAEQKGKLGTAGLRIPLYIDPPASKPWVGLEPQDFTGVIKGDAFEAGAYWANNILREKNA